MPTIFESKALAATMKAATIFLSLCLAISFGLLAYQHHSYSALFERQSQAIALVQRRYDASLRENEVLRARSHIEARSRIAFLQAQPIAARYQRLLKAQSARGR
jgi:hypothetical protein